KNSRPHRIPMAEPESAVSAKNRVPSPRTPARSSDGPAVPVDVGEQLHTPGTELVHRILDLRQGRFRRRLAAHAFGTYPYCAAIARTPSARGVCAGAWRSSCLTGIDSTSGG